MKKYKFNYSETNLDRFNQGHDKWQGLEEGKDSPVRINIGDTFNPTDGGQLKVTNIYSVYSRNQWMAVISYEYVSPDGKKGKAEKESTSFVHTYLS